MSNIFQISDIQECPVQFESFKYNESFMNFSWLGSAIEFGKGIHFASFALLQIKYNNCSAEYHTGRYPCQKVRFVLQRKLGYFFIQVHLWVFGLCIWKITQGQNDKLRMSEFQHYVKILFVFPHIHWIQICSEHCLIRMLSGKLLLSLLQWTLPALRSSLNNNTVYINSNLNSCIKIQ